MNRVISFYQRFDIYAIFWIRWFDGKIAHLEVAWQFHWKLRSAPSAEQTTKNCAISRRNQSANYFFAIQISKITVMAANFDLQEGSPTLSTPEASTLELLDLPDELLLRIFANFTSFEIITELSLVSNSTFFWIYFCHRPKMFTFIVTNSNPF